MDREAIVQAFRDNDNSCTERWEGFTFGADADIEEIHQNSADAILALQSPREQAAEEMFDELEKSVVALAQARDAFATLIKDKAVKWESYVDLTSAMRIPQINVLLSKARGDNAS